MTNNKQIMKLYTERQMKEMFRMGLAHSTNEDGALEQFAPIELPSDEEIEEKLNVAYGNGYEQGEMDFYKKMQEKGNEYADGYAEGYKRALELVKHKIDNDLQGGNNEQQ